MKPTKEGENRVQKGSEIMAKRGAIDSEWSAKLHVPARLVVIFTRQLASMLASGVPLAQAMDTLSHQPDAPVFGEVIRLCGQRLETGSKLSHCLTFFPRVFPTIFVTMVAIGEETGALEDALERLAIWLERDDALRQRLKSAVTYPGFVLSLSVGLTLALFYTVMPGFISIFTDMKVELPLITRIVVAITNYLRNPGAVLAGLAVLGLGLHALRRWLATPRGWLSFFSVALRLPVLGPMLRFGGISRYCAAMEALLETGMDITRSLQLAAAASGSPVIEKDSALLVASVISAGGMVSEHMRYADDVYPATMTNLVASGEETSQLSEMYGRCAAYYDMEMNYKVEALGAALEPLMLFLVSMVVGTIVLSVFLPMYSYIDQIGG